MAVDNNRGKGVVPSVLPPVCRKAGLPNRALNYSHSSLFQLIGTIPVPLPFLSKKYRPHFCLPPFTPSGDRPQNSFLSRHSEDYRTTFLRSPPRNEFFYQSSNSCPEMGINNTSIGESGVWERGCGLALI